MSKQSVQPTEATIFGSIWKKPAPGGVILRSIFWGPFPALAGLPGQWAGITSQLTLYFHQDSHLPPWHVHHQHNKLYVYLCDQVYKEKLLSIHPTIKLAVYQSILSSMHPSLGPSIHLSNYSPIHYTFPGIPVNVTICPSRCKN